MHNQKFCFLLRIIYTVFVLTGCVQKQTDFLAMQKIDAHVHIRYSGSEFLEQAAKDNFKVIAILTDHYDIAWQQDFIDQQKNIHPEQFDYLTTFTMQGWDEPDWQEKTTAHLKNAFEKGAIGVKVWKNIGMEFKDKNDNFVMIDDSKFDPIFDFIESEGKTLTGHIGEPKDCWLPLDKMMASSNREYYKEYPEYHMYLHPELPSYEDHIKAYEHVLEKHPNSRYVACHLASIEWSMKELAMRLDRFPNMAVDLAARIDDLQLLEREPVRRFFMEYQDRILYGTDLSIKQEHDPKTFTAHMNNGWMQDWIYFSTDSVMTIPGIEKPVRGLNLPVPVLKKIYRVNAQKWYLGT